METQNYSNIIILLSTVVVILVGYRLLITKENFEVDICDYNSPDPNAFCQSIQKGCADLIYENKNLNENMKDNCTTLPKDTKDMIDAAIVCNDTSNKLIMNNYVQKEICSQIKNYPIHDPPVTEVLKPETNMLQQTSMVYQKIEPPSTYKPLDPLPFLTKDVNNENNQFFDFGTVNYAPF